MRYLKNTKDGTIYEWNELLAQHPLCKEITELEAFPEKFIPAGQEERQSKLDFSSQGVSGSVKAVEPVVEQKAKAKAKPK